MNEDFVIAAWPKGWSEPLASASLAPHSRRTAALGVAAPVGLALAVLTLTVAARQIHLAPAIAPARANTRARTGAVSPT